MRKLLLLLSTLIFLGAVAALVTPNYLGRQIQLDLEHDVKKLSADNQIVNLSLTNYQRGWMQSSADLMVEIPQLSYQKKLQLNIYHGPLIVRGSGIDYQRAIIETAVKNLPGGLEATFTTKYNFDQHFQGVLKFKPVENPMLMPLKIEQIYWRFDGTRPDFNDMHFGFQMQNISGELPNAMGQYNLEDALFSISKVFEPQVTRYRTNWILKQGRTKITQNPVMGNYEMTFESLQLRNVYLIPGKLTDFKQQMQNPLQFYDQFLGDDTQFRIEQLRMQSKYFSLLMNVNLKIDPNNTLSGLPKIMSVAGGMNMNMPSIRFNQNGYKFDLDNFTMMMQNQKFAQGYAQMKLDNIQLQHAYKGKMFSLRDMNWVMRSDRQDEDKFNRSSQFHMKSFCITTNCIRDIAYEMNFNNFSIQQLRKYLIALDKLSKQAPEVYAMWDAYKTLYHGVTLEVKRFHFVTQEGPVDLTGQLNINADSKGSDILGLDNAISMQFDLSFPTVYANQWLQSVLPGGTQESYPWPTRENASRTLANITTFLIRQKYIIIENKQMQFSWSKQGQDLKMGQKTLERIDAAYLLLNAQHYRNAFELLKSEAAKNNKDAHYLMAYLYRFGLGVNANHNTAKSHLNRADQLGHAFAKMRIRQLDESDNQSDREQNLEIRN